MKKRKPKYANYAELAAAFKSGELGEHYFLRLDKGAMENRLRYFNGDLTDEENEAKQEECRSWFDGDRDVDELFEALGIRAEWC